MPDRYPHFWGGSQICGQSAPPVKGTNGEKLKMLNCKFACISDPAANTMQTAVIYKFSFLLVAHEEQKHKLHLGFVEIQILKD